ncbi:hypothetical protein [Streptomyces sp. NPDC051310]|uniref:hypothetical protein n=1 Tax=Streptomyces sp. NPDC051310 TaxID=3365649 RepID=UPI0037BAF050
MVAAMQLDLAAITAPAVGLFETELDAANAVLADWGHYLGINTRPFGAQAWRLDVAGEPISIAVSASTVSSTVAGYGRGQVVELARLCTRPDSRWATRVMLRLWREIGAPAWPYWPAVAAVAYSDNARHPGNIYRFDGWTRITETAGSSGGGTWSTRRDAEHPARGAKSLWLWEYPTTAQLDHPIRDAAA